MHLKTWCIGQMVKQPVYHYSSQAAIYITTVVKLQYI